ncbi:helix-turn-helix transcriptional regulator [Nonomuraea sp. NPDC049158]|uniref:helix-turn-helix transcriptional regulator n=1 Tax=Nonomuraea sp. NPDC049158 TaxID=3155649 RepID=UPI0033C6476F
MIPSEDRLFRELNAAMGQGASPDELGEAISRAVSRWVSHDALRLVGTSPATGLGLGSFSFWHRYEPALIRALAMSRYLDDDPCRPAALARRPVPVGLVGAGCGGDRCKQHGEGPCELHGDRLTREVLLAHGAGCELRLLLRDSHGVWGLLGLIRSEGGRPFGAEDADRAVRLAPALLAALRRYVTVAPLTPSFPALPAGLIVIGADHAIRAVTPQARAWLAQMWTPGRCDLPDWLADTSMECLSLDTRTYARDPDSWRPRICAPAAIFGRWTVIEGQPLSPDGDGDVAIVIQAATGPLLLPSFCDWYGITPRERCVVECLYAGAAPKQIARRLDLSVHTVNDHLKAVFRKTGASGRDELMAALTS